MDNKTRSARTESKLLKLLKLSANKYKIRLDESIMSFQKENRSEEILWCEYIPAHKGMIYLSCASPIELVFFTESTKILSKIERELKDDVKIVKLDGEGLVFFPHTLIKKMFKLARAKTRRTLSEEHKQKLINSRKKE